MFMVELMDKKTKNTHTIGFEVKKDRVIFINPSNKEQIAVMSVETAMDESGDKPVPTDSFMVGFEVEEPIQHRYATAYVENKKRKKK